MKTPFKTKAGLLTAYALSCGYIQQAEKGSVKITLWHEHGCYHVRAISDGTRLFWDSFKTLSRARNRYTSMKGGNA